MTERPVTMTYGRVLSLEIVRLALMIAALNDLEAKCGNLDNAYITSLITEKFWSILRPKFGADSARKAIIVCDLYGLKSGGDSFLAHLCICMRGLCYEPCLDDPDLW